MSQLSSLWSLCHTVLAIKVLTVWWGDRILYITEEMSLEMVAKALTEKETKIYDQLFFRASKIKYYSIRRDVKWRKGEFKFSFIP